MKSFNFDNMNLKSLKILNDYLQDIITVFSANNNQLNDIPLNFFKNLKKINKIDLSHNFFLEINEIIYEKTTLTYLDFSFNHLTRVSGKIINLENLKEMNFSHNYFIDFNIISEEQAIYLANLEKIDLSFNSLETFPGNFLYCPCLETIILNNNKISDILFKEWTKSVAKNLNLGFNKLRTLPKGLLQNSKISNLNLKENLITKSEFLKMDGYENFEKRRKERKDQGFLNNLDISFGICGLE